MCTGYRYLFFSIVWVLVPFWFDCLQCLLSCWTHGLSLYSMQLHLTDDVSALRALRCQLDASVGHPLQLAVETSAWTTEERMARPSFLVKEWKHVVCELWWSMVLRVMLWPYPVSQSWWWRWWMCPYSWQNGHSACKITLQEPLEVSLKAFWDCLVIQAYLKIGH